MGIFHSNNQLSACRRWLFSPFPLFPELRLYRSGRARPSPCGGCPQSPCWQTLSKRPCCAGRVVKTKSMCTVNHRTAALDVLFLQQVFFSSFLLLLLFCSSFCESRFGMAAASEKSIKLTSSDGRDFEVPLAVAKMSLTVRNMLEGLFFGATACPLACTHGRPAEILLPYAATRALTLLAGAASIAEAKMEGRNVP
jgi:hypothetical protein